MKTVGAAIALPVRIGPHYKCDIHDANGALVAQSAPQFTAAGELRAECVVRTLNAHDALVTACEEIVGGFEVYNADTAAMECRYCEAQEGESHDDDCTMQHVLAALRTARGEA